MAECSPAQFALELADLVASGASVEVLLRHCRDRGGITEERALACIVATAQRIDAAYTAGLLGVALHDHTREVLKISAEVLADEWVPR